MKSKTMVCQLIWPIIPLGFQFVSISVSFGLFFCYFYETDYFYHHCFTIFEQIQCFNCYAILRWPKWISITIGNSGVFQSRQKIATNVKSCKINDSKVKVRHFQKLLKSCCFLLSSKQAYITFLREYFSIELVNYQSERVIHFEHHF